MSSMFSSPRIRRAWGLLPGLLVAAAPRMAEACAVCSPNAGDPSGPAFARAALFLSLIPLFMLPASRGRWADAIATGILFGVLTVGAMVALVLLGRAGLRRIATPATERWAHAMAGGVIAMSGAAVLFLGL